jgi:hypothetical protein
VSVVFDWLIKCRGDYLSIHRAAHVRDLLRALADEQDDEMDVLAVLSKRLAMFF